jgi:cyanate lyase
MPVPAHDSVAAMVSSYAEQALALARDFNAQLDYSENSLMEVETILSSLSREMPLSKPSDDDVSEICKIWGCYLGEVVRRRFGGEWSIETYPGKQFATLTLNVDGNKLFPSIKAL